MKKKLTVSIGIPAHNEEKNIGSLLNSLLSQKHDLYELQAINVICDACTDNTAVIVDRYVKEDKRVKLFNDQRRLGKASRLNELFSISRSDVLLLIDADILPENNKLIDEIIKEFSKNKVALVGVKDIPAITNGFISRIVNAGVDLWFEVRKAIHNKDSVHNIHGNIYAVRKSLYKKISFPIKIINDDMFIYIKAHELGHEASFSENSAVYYHTPDNLKDFYKQTNRFFVARDQIDKYFGKKVLKYFEVSQESKKLGIKISLKRDPIFTFLAVVLHFSVRLVIPFMSVQYDKRGRWNPINSTKRSIRDE